MKLQTTCLLLLLTLNFTLAGCQRDETPKSDSSQSQETESQKKEVKKESPSPQPKESQPKETQTPKADSTDKKPAEKEFKNTGLHSDEILKALNDNSKGGQYKHHFVVIKESDDDVLYGDQHSETKLLLIGPKDDLLVAEFAMKMDEFVSGGESDIDQGAALSSCIERMCGVLAPSEPEKIHNWMKKNVKRAVFTAEGAQTEHQHLLIIFDSQVTSKGTKTINFAIVLPE